MSDYSKSTNFTAKDTLPTGNAGKIVKGTEIDTEFTAIASAISSKADVSSPALLGTPTAPTATAGSNTTQIANTAYVKTEISSSLSAVYPVGSIYINAGVSTNPNTLLGFGTWAEFGAGKVLVGLDAGDALFDTLEETGGSKNAINVSHTHTATSTVTDPGHTHGVLTYRGNAPDNWISGSFSNSAVNTYATNSATTGITVATTNSTEGSSGTNANIQPYIVVKMWKRTA